MKTAPLISVYITNHNYGRFIEEAINSVLNQSMSDYEIIIIDDGSEDNSKEIIERYTKNEKIKVIFQKRKGLNITNNIAMRTALGKYIMRLDADDYLDSNALLVLSNALERDPELGMIFPDYYLVDEIGDVQSIEKRHDFSNEVKLLDQPAHGACTMIRREFLMQLNGYNESYECQDGYELWVKFIKHYKVDNVNTPLFYYRQHGNNLTNNENKILETRAKIKNDHVEEHHQDVVNAFGIIPVRDYKNSRKNLAFEKLEGRSLLDWKIEEAVSSNKLKQVIVSSPDDAVRKYVQTNYGNNEKVLFLYRDIHLARLNIDLTETIEQAIEAEALNFNPDAFVILGLEFPFINASIIDDAINTMQIFNSDSLISVRPDTSLFFQHQGNGMEPILNQAKFTKLEREALYRYTGGISLSKISYFNETKNTIGGKTGHIIIDQVASHGIFTEYDLDVARFLASKSRFTSGSN